MQADRAYTNYANDTMALEATYCKLDAAGTEGSQLAKGMKKKAKEKKKKGVSSDPDITARSSSLSAAKTACKEAAAKVKEAKLAVTTTRAKVFQLYGNLLSDKARQPWKIVMKAQVKKLLGRMSLETTTPRLPSKLGIPSTTASCSTYKQCFDLMLERPSSNASPIL